MSGRHMNVTVEHQLAIIQRQHCTGSQPAGFPPRVPEGSGTKERQTQAVEILTTWGRNLPFPTDLAIFPLTWPNWLERANFDPPQL